MEEQLPTQDITTVSTESQQVKQEPIKDVETFWERLDEVLTLVKSGGTRSNLAEELLERFPEIENIQQRYRSFLFQPERLALSSNDDIGLSNNLSNTYDIRYEGDKLNAVNGFSNFRIRLKKSLVNVKSVQLLSCVIPNANQNLPDYSTFFFYYRIATIANSSQGNWLSAVAYDTGQIVFNVANNQYYYALRPNFNDQPDLSPLDWQSISTIAMSSLGNWSGATNYAVRDIVFNVADNNYYQSLQNNNLNQQPDVSPLWWELVSDGDRPNYYDLILENLQFVRLLPSLDLPEQYPAVDNNLFNRTYQDYTDLAQALNQCAGDARTASIAGDVSFVYNPVLNKIQFVPNNIDGGYFYLPAGYGDPNVTTKINQLNNNRIYLVPGYTLNLRCGFTWNGEFTDPLNAGDIYSPDSEYPGSFYYYLRPVDPILVPSFAENLLTANSYADLVNTSCVKVYCDFAFGSTEDSEGNGGLLSIVPVNTNNLGVGFYQNNFSNPLTKIPQNITEVGINLVNDQGQPYFLPNSATVLLELAVDYK
jgi:hypothetical protein